MNVLEGEAVIENDGPIDPQTQYVVEGAIVPRPALPGFSKLTIAADGVDAAVLTLAQPFAAEVDGVTYSVDAPTEGVYRLEITSTMPAVYKASVKHWPYLDYSAEITVT